MSRRHLRVGDFDIVEINEAFASQIIGSVSKLSLHESDPRIACHDGPITLGHPPGIPARDVCLPRPTRSRRPSAAGHSSLCAQEWGRAFRSRWNASENKPAEIILGFESFMIERVNDPCLGLDLQLSQNLLDLPRDACHPSKASARRQGLRAI
jgi:Thiolase, C-terminal domain